MWLCEQSLRIWSEVRASLFQSQNVREKKRSESERLEFSLRFLLGVEGGVSDEWDHVAEL